MDGWDYEPSEVEMLDALTRKVNHLRALNTDLLAACKIALEAVRSVNVGMMRYDAASTIILAREKCEAAIRKAEGKEE